MRTVIDVDDDLLREAQQVLATTTKRDTVNTALREVVQRSRRAQLWKRMAGGDFATALEAREQAWR